MFALINQAASLAQAGDFKGVAALARNNPGFATDILGTAFQSAPTQRAALIAATLAESPAQRTALVVAAGRSGSPSQVLEEGLLAGLPPADMVRAAGDIIAKNAAVATVVASQVGRVSGIPQPKIAAVLTAAAPSSAANIVAGLLLTSSQATLTNEQIPLHYASIAAAAAAQAPSQAVAILSHPQVVTIITSFNRLGAYDTSNQITAVFAAALAKVVPTQAAAITTAALNAIPNSWVSGFSSNSFLIVNTIANAVPANQAPAIAAAADAVAKSRPDGQWEAGRSLQGYLNSTSTPNSTLPALVETAVSGGLKAAAAPLPTPPPPLPPLPATPATPIDPTMNVSRSS